MTRAQRVPRRHEISPFLLVHVCSLILLPAVVWAGPALPQTYVGPDNGLWTTATNWNPNGVPNTDSVVTLGSHSAGTTDLHVTFNGTQSQRPDFVTLDSTGLTGSMIVNQTDPNSYLNAIDFTIGKTVPGNVWNQSAGNIFCSSMAVGLSFSSGSGNVFNLSGTGSMVVNLTVGVSGGGTFNQTGGYIGMSFGGSNFGYNYGSNGTYNMSGGMAEGDGVIRVAYQGTATVNQSGGIISMSRVDIGGRTNAHGTYNMMGGTLNAPFEGINVGGLRGADETTDGVGLFNMTGGMVNASVKVGGNGTFILAGGTLNLNNTNSNYLEIEKDGLFAMKGGTLISGGETLVINGGEFRLGSSSATFRGLDGTGGSVLNNSASALDFASVSTLTLDLNQVNYDFAGNIGNSTGGYGLVGITKSGLLKQTFSGANTYSGPTAINQGTLAAGSNGGFSPNSAHTLSSVATLDANGFNVFTGSLAGVAGAVVKVGSGSLTTGGNNQSTAYAGTLTGSGTLVKAGAGEWTLSNSASAFNGTIDVKAGALRVGAVNGVPTNSYVNLSGSGAAFNVASNQSILGLSSSVVGATTNLLNGSRLTVGSGVGQTYLGSLAGDGGELRKLGTSVLTLGAGVKDMTATMTAGSSLLVNVTQGTVALNKASGTVAIGGPLALNGGNVLLNRGNQIADTSALTVNAGQLSLNGFSETVGNLDGTAGEINLGGGALTVTQSTYKSVGAALTGGGSFTKTGAAPLSLTGVGSYGGTFTANTDHLYLQGAVSATGGTANSGGILDFVGGTAELNGGAIVSKAGGYVQFFGATINNASLQGAGAQIVVGGMYPASTLNNSATTGGATLFQNGLATLNSFTNGGTLQNNAALTYNGGLNTATGTINVNSTVAATNFSSNGTINVPKGGALNDTGGNLALGSGSRTYVGTEAAPGGLLTMTSGASIELNDGLFANYGTQTGVLNVNNGSTAKGAGTFGTVNVTKGGTFGVNAPTAGSNLQVNQAAFLLASSPALVGPLPATTPADADTVSLTLGSGSAFAFTLQNAQGAPGAGYDLVHDAGVLTLSAGVTPGNQITVTVASLTVGGLAGPAVNFNPAQTYQFVLVQADGGIAGFQAGRFVVDASGFANGLQGGGFSVAQSGNNLLLVYAPAPEPATWAMLAVGGVLMGAVLRRRAGRLFA